jgi:hypothetical protein
MKGDKALKVCYDNINDVVSVYYQMDDKEERSCDDSSKEDTRDGGYSTDEAANLIIDTLDIYEGGKQIGFRVFNASKHYDMELLMHADKEILSKEELKKIPNEKIIAKFSSQKGNLYMP